MSLAAKQNYPPEEQENCLIDFTRFSNWNRLVNCMAYVLRAKEAFKKQGRQAASVLVRRKEKREIESLTVKEVSEAEKLILIWVQKYYPPTEDETRNLNIFQADDQLFRAKGRLANSGLNFQANNPIYLNHRAPIVRLLLRRAHLNTKHGGLELINTYLRQEYWMTRSRRTINNWLRAKGAMRCGACARWQAKPFTLPKAPDLPTSRTAGRAAFQAVGLDYFGPFRVLQGEEEIKCWGAIFTCALTRAVHLEVVTDCTSEKFLLALTRFIRRRRPPKVIISDNAPTFVLASKVIQDLNQEEINQKKEWIELISSNRIQDFLLLNKIQWKFNTPAAPWRGGFYERLIGSIKKHLYRTIGRRKLTHEELETLLIEVERIVNERPLTYYTSEEVAYPLRPIDILDCSAGNPFDVHLSPEPDWDNDYEEQPSNRSALLEAHKKALQKSHKFWETWKSEYLLSLREKWRSNNKDPTFPKLNQVVLMNEGHEKCPRSLWKMAKIEEILSGRTVKVRMGGKIYERATSVLYPLELENEEDPPDDEAARTEELNKRNKSNENNKKTTERRKRYYFRSNPVRGDEKRREKIEEE
uniref:Integrase catalytic domain-containing protein n=1 Tax=Meloidogyne incognita TaxID=6306 RepID=A0A914MS77_MELIC